MFETNEVFRNRGLFDQVLRDCSHLDGADINEFDPLGETYSSENNARSNEIKLLDD